MKAAAPGTTALLAALGVGTLALAAPTATVARQPAPRTLYVKAGVRAGGDGSRRAPFASLQRVQRGSRAGDAIVVLRSPAGVAPLDGGIALKPHQTLVGAGRPVTRTRWARAPRIENTDPGRLAGDAVELADGATVRNLAIGPSSRAGIYGANVRGARIVGNDVSSQNTSCAVGFVVLPFVLPTTLPGVGVPIAGGLPNGWAGIMVDEDRGSADLTIARNYVHDAECGDGIDVRLSGGARVDARIARNRLTRLRQGPNLVSVLAIGMQTQGVARLTATLRRNTEADIGSRGADSEGVFANLAGRSRLHAVVERNSWHHGIGGFSVNGMEMVTSSGSPRARMRIADSTFSDGPGDLLEAINFGTGATMRLALDHVVATRSTGLGNTQVLPGNAGDCLAMGHSGAGDATYLRMRDTELSHCANNGLTVASGVDNGSQGAARALSFDIDRSRIIDNRGDNLRVVTENGLASLEGKVQRTDLSGAGLIDVALDQLLGATADASLDFGGGPLGSVGRNCIFDGGVLDAETIGYRATARHDWWGRAGGPGLGRTVFVGGGIDAALPLGAPPASSCAGPGAP